MYWNGMKWIFLIPVWIKDGLMFTHFGKSLGGTSAQSLFARHLLAGLLCHHDQNLQLNLTLFWLRGRISIGNRIYRLKGNNTIIYEIDLDFSKWLASNYVKEISLYKCDLIRGYLCFIRCTATVFAWKIRFLAASSPSPSNIQTFIYNLEVSIRIVDTNQVTFRPKLFD